MNSIKNFLESIKSSVMGMSVDSDSDALKNVQVSLNNILKEESVEVRKNLGLYYEETSVGEKTAMRQTVSIEPLVKIADDTPEKSDIISVGSHNMDDISFVDSDFGYSIRFSEIELFQIRNIPTDDYPIGIYALLAAVGAALVYKGEVTTVSKIDAKFLPEQEGGAIEPVTLLQVPTESISLTAVTRTNYISDEDWDKLFNGETCIAKYNNNYYLVTVTEDNSVPTYPTKRATFIGDRGFKFAISTASSYTSILVTPINYVKYLSGLPTNEMSSADIVNLGFNLALMSDCYSGNVKALNASQTLANIISVRQDANYTVEFWTDTDKYIVSCPIFGGDFTCTVTPR